ncbi:hypothetical protein DWU95_23965, partial [Burkholderia contaminans]
MTMKANAAAPAPSPAMQSPLDADDAWFFLIRTRFFPGCLPWSPFPFPFLLSPSFSSLLPSFFRSRFLLLRSVPSLSFVVARSF